MDACWRCCLDAFLQSIEDVSGSVRSRATYAYTLTRFFADGRNPDQYSRADVVAFVNASSTLKYTRGTPVKAGTKNQRLMVLQSFYKFTAIYEINGCSLLQSKPPTLGLKYLKTGPTYKSLSADELTRFFAVIPTDTIKGIRDRAVFLCYFWCGRRRSEIARLCWRDIEQAVIVEPDGTRRAGVIYRYVAKGKSRETQVAELPTPAWNAILCYLQAAHRLSTMQPDSPLFASLRPDQPNHALTGGYCNGLFKHYARLAALPASYSLHSLRHTAARERFRAGSSIQDVQVFLGHSSIGTTDVYLKRLSGIADPGAKLLEQRFSSL